MSTVAFHRAVNAGASAAMPRLQARCISHLGEGHALYPVLSSSFCYMLFSSFFSHFSTAVSSTTGCCFIHVMIAITDSNMMISLARGL